MQRECKTHNGVENQSTKTTSDLTQILKSEKQARSDGAWL